VKLMHAGYFLTNYNKLSTVEWCWHHSYLLLLFSCEFTL